MREGKYVPITLDQFINESQTFTLKRGYKGKEPVIVGAKAPLRDQILSFVSESKRVSKGELRKFISGLNEGKGRKASAAMWLKRNGKFFIAESKNGITYYKLSTVGKRLINRFGFIKENQNRDVLDERKKTKNKKIKEDHDFDFVDTKKGYPRPGITDSCEDDDKKVNEMTVRELKEIFSSNLNEGEEEDELSFDDLDLGDEEEKNDDKTEDNEEISDEGEEKEEKVEITEFIITVDNADDAIAELSELGVDASKVEDEGEDLEGDLEGKAEGEEVGFEGGGELEDLDLEDEKEKEDEVGEEELDLEEGAEIGANIVEAGEDEEGIEARLSDLEDKVENLETEVKTEEEVEDLEAPEEGVEDLEAPEEGKDLDLETPEKDLEDEAELGKEEIKVSAENWDALSKWLEEKGVDLGEMLGGEIEVEDEEVEDETEEDSDEKEEDETEEDSDEKEKDKDKEDSK